MTKITLKDKVALMSLGIMFITFPPSGQYILQALDWIFKEIFMYGSPVFLVAGTIVSANLLWIVLWDKREITNIPTGKTKKQKYIVT